MARTVSVALLALVLVAAPLSAGEITGKYIEARTCDVWTGPCFANAEVNFAGKTAIIGWQIDKGSMNEVDLGGLGIVAVIKASDTLGVKQTGSAKAVFIVDSKANALQRKALVSLAKQQAGKLVENVVHVETAKFSLEFCPCQGNSCATLKAGPAKIETRCLDKHKDKICGNETAFYPPLSKNVKAKAALAVENRYSGKGMGETWNDAGRRSVYLGSFSAR